MSNGKQNKHPKTLEQAVLTKGVIGAIAYAVNHPGTVADLGSDEYHQLMDMFQDWVPFKLIDHNQWWSCHYLSSGRRCSKCFEIARLSPCDGQDEVRHLQARVRNMILGHADDCSVRNGCTFEGLMVCLTLEVCYPFKFLSIAQG